MEVFVLCKGNLQLLLESPRVFSADLASIDQKVTVLLLSDHIITQVEDWNNYKAFLTLPTALLMRSMGCRWQSREKKEKSVAYSGERADLMERELDWPSVGKP